MTQSAQILAAAHGGKPVAGAGLLPASLAAPRIPAGRCSS